MSKFNLEEIRKLHHQGHIAIVGNAPSMALRQTDDKGLTTNVITMDMSDYPYPIWTVNGGWHYHPQSVLGWKMDDLENGTRYGEHDQLEWYDRLMKNSSIPIIAPTEYKNYPALVRFPLEDILEFFAKRCRNTNFVYFTETISYMFALAIYWGIKEIDLYGCDYHAEERFAYENHGANFWCGMATAFGIQINISEMSHLMRFDLHEDFQPGFYGYLQKNFPLNLDEYAIKLEGLCQAS